MNPLFRNVCLTVVLVTVPLRGQTTQPLDKTGTIRLDGTDYRYTLTPTTAPPVTPPATPSVPAFKVLPFNATAPATVHVNALDIPLASGTPLTAKYEWDFGDGTPTARLPGWNAAHVYDTPGTYTLSLRLTVDRMSFHVGSMSVVIKANTRKTLHIAQEGDDSNPGTVDRPLKTFIRASNLLRDNTQLLFRRGDRFDIQDVEMNLRSKNVLIGAYGDDTKPRPVFWKLPSTKTRLAIMMYRPAADVVIQDICFDGPYTVEPGKGAPKVPFDGINPIGDNITIRRCEFRNITTAVSSERKVSGLLFEGNSAPLDTGIRGYMVWGQGSDHVYLNNTCANSTREHGFRINFATRLLIAGNTMTNLDRAAQGDKDDIAKGCIEMHTGSYAYIANNTVHSGALRVGPRGGDTEPADTAMEWAVIEGNQVTGSAISVRPGTHHAVLRNNVVRNEEGVKVFRADSAGRTSTDIVIDHNTTIAPSEIARFLNVEGKAERITLTNNLLIAPKMVVGKDAAAAVYVGMSDISCFDRIAGNVWSKPASSVKFAGEGGLFYIGNKWGEPAGYIPFDKWKSFPQVSGDDVASDLGVDDNGQPNAAAIARGAGALQSR